MEFTGERVIPGKTDPDLFNEHLARYRFAESLVGGRQVLDAGCGAGYGAAVLAAKAEVVFALDIDGEAVELGRREFDRPNIRWLRGGCDRLPFAERSLDVVAAFEVIEHLENWRGLLEEARRVLRPDGQLLVSTPNRLYYQESRGEPNPYHVREFSHDEFRRELSAIFPHVAIFLENHAAAIAFTPERTQGVRTALIEGERKPDEAHFFLAVCSGRPQYGSPAFVFVPDSGNIVKARETHIRRLEGFLAKATADLETMTRVNVEEQRRAQEAIDRLEVELAEKIAWAEERHREVERLQGEYEERHREVERLQGEYEERTKELKFAVAKIDELEQRVIERSEWAQGLDREIDQLRARLAEIYASPAYRIGRRLRLAPP